MAGFEPSKETLALLFGQLNGAQRFRWLTWIRYTLTDKRKASEWLESNLADALLGVYSTAIRQYSWPRIEAESNRFRTDLEKLQQMVGTTSGHVKRYMPGLILSEAEEYMLSQAIQERLHGYAKVADALIEDLKQALASEEMSLRIDDGIVRMVNGRLAIIMFEVDLDKARALVEEGD